MRSGFRPRDLSLRVRLLVALVALAAVGLVVADFVSYRALHSYLYDRVDQQLESSVAPMSMALAHQLPPGSLPALRKPRRVNRQGPPPEEDLGPGGPSSQLPPGTFGQLRLANGTVYEVLVSLGETGLPRPDLPEELVAARPGAASPETVGQKGGGDASFRVIAVAGPAHTTTIVAIPLGDTQSTLDRLAVIELVVSAAILIALGVAAWYLVGVGLRPLRRMGEVAGDIAAGDLTRRVEPADSRTEVGRLGLALNAMLVQIEGAFAEREAGERRLRRFLADASHELRTPLASIRGYAELYRIGAAREPAEVERSMQRIEAESARMGGLVDDLLTLARVDELRAPLREPVALGELLADACDDARASAPGREITLTAGEGVMVEGDADQLHRVFANLLRNAVLHTPEGTPVEVSLASEGGEAVTRVRDHGGGLPPDQPEAVFERFWRESGSRGRDDGGAGLGLAIAAAVVHAHRGEVQARNADGGGAEFTVRLPLQP
jgi:two-component system OmpR family sensor kinase